MSEANEHGTPKGARSAPAIGCPSAKRMDELETTVHSSPLPVRAALNQESGGVHRPKMTTFECLQYLYAHRPNQK